MFLLVFFLFISCFSTCFVVKAESKTIVVPDDYLTITAAVSEAADGDTVFVKTGTYSEHTLLLDKSISLVGEDVNSTIIQNIDRYEWDFSFPEPPLPAAIQVEADKVTVSGFTIDVPLYLHSGHIYENGDNAQITGNVLKHGQIFVSGSHIIIASNIINGSSTCISCDGSYNNITENKLIGLAEGVQVDGSFNTISHNIITVSGASSIGISYDSSFNTIFKNIITGGGTGIFIDGGFNNTIFGNTLTKCSCGFGVMSGYNNVFYLNHVANTQLGAYLGYDQTDIARELGGPATSQNFLYKNNFIDNSRQAVDWNWLETNYWLKGEQGNYWSDYNGTDKNADGIGDTPYLLSEAISNYASSTQSKDPYPLITPVDVESIPEFPSWSIVSLALIASFAAIICRHKITRKISKQRIK